MKNSVELIGHYGSDLIHGLSAWTSTSRNIDEKKLERIPGLLTMLAEAEHHTPFEKSVFHFLVDVDQATHIHLLKHRIGVSINGESARYKELKEDKMYIPEDWNIKTKDGVEIIGGYKEAAELSWASILEKYSLLSNELYHKCLEELTPVLGRQRAKESARFFKAMNSQITLDISFNWRSFYHFYHLRSSDHAQEEIKAVAEEMLKQIKNIEGSPFKETIKAFGL